MGKDLLMRVLPDLKFTYLPFLQVYLDVLERCRARGCTYMVLSTWRSYKKQMELYAQGRTNAGIIITHNKAGRSAHNFGAAADCVLDFSCSNVALPSHDPKNYTVLAEEAKRAGLEWGGDMALKEYGHVAWPGLTDRKRLRQLDVAFRSVGLQAVWDILDEEGGGPGRVA